MQHSAEQINQFQALGLGEIAYLKLLFCEDVLALVPGADIKPGEFCFALIDADGSPRLIRGNVADVLIAAAEGNLRVVPVH